jgi:hypothetical protein
MMSVRSTAVGLLVAAAGLAACENLPYYDESLDLFSRSPYDPTIEAIEERTPPPGDSPVLSAPSGDAAMVLPGPAALRPVGNLRSLEPIEVDPPGRGPVVSELRESELGPTPDHVVVPAALPPRLRITPPMGFARSKRVILGDNRGPFQTGSMRTLR